MKIYEGLFKKAGIKCEINSVTIVKYVIRDLEALKGKGEEKMVEWC